MRKVFLIWFSRKILPYVVIDFLALGFFAYLIGEYVFVQVVFENLSRILFSSPAGLAGYVFGALWGTKLVVQVSLAAVLAAVVLAFKNGRAETGNQFQAKSVLIIYKGRLLILWQIAPQTRGSLFFCVFLDGAAIHSF